MTWYRIAISAIVLYVVVVLVILGVVLWTGLASVDDLLAFLVSLGGLLVAAISLTATQSARVDAQRQALFEKQLEAYASLDRAIRKVTTALADPAVEDRLTRDMTNRIREAKVGFHDVISSGWFFYPSEVQKSIGMVRKDIDEVIERIETPPFDAASYTSYLVNSYVKHIISVASLTRSSVGLEKLRGETIALLGLSDEYQKLSREATDAKADKTKTKKRAARGAKLKQKSR